MNTNEYPTHYAAKISRIYFSKQNKSEIGIGIEIEIEGESIFIALTPEDTVKFADRLQKSLHSILS